MQGFFKMEKAQAKLLKTLDPNSGYTMEDFNEEFSSGNMFHIEDSSKLK